MCFKYPSSGPYTQLVIILTPTNHFDGVGNAYGLTQPRRGWKFSLTSCITFPYVQQADFQPHVHKFILRITKPTKRLRNNQPVKTGFNDLLSRLRRGKQKKKKSRRVQEWGRYFCEELWGICCGVIFLQWCWILGMYEYTFYSVLMMK